MVSQSEPARADPGTSDGARAPRAAAALDRPLVLVGLMGAGKSTVGRRLAQRLSVPFVDADAEIEAAANMSIADMFARFGEPAFRDGERRVIARLIDGRPRVIATGGGAFIDPETRALVLASARSVWLDAAIEVLAERVSRRDHRPLLHGRDAREALAELAERRNPIYAEADIHIHTDERPHDLAVEMIIEALKA